jgi:hypothetical protein
MLGDGRSPVRVSGESCRTLQVIISTQKSFLAMCRIDAARDAIDLWAYVSCGMVQAGWCSWHVYGLTAIPRECDNPPKTQQNELCGTSQSVFTWRHRDQAQLTWIIEPDCELFKG